jgi:hypothetical protein
MRFDLPGEGEINLQSSFQLFFKLHCSTKHCHALAVKEIPTPRLAHAYSGVNSFSFQGVRRLQQASQHKAAVIGRYIPFLYFL